jgi:hypothetical protein
LLLRRRSSAVQVTTRAEGLALKRSIHRSTGLSRKGDASAALAASILEAARLTGVLQAIKDGATSFSDSAKALGWYDRKNGLDRSKAQRTIGRLKRAKLVAVEGGGHILTEKGKIWSSVCTCFQTDDGNQNSLR